MASRKMYGVRKTVRGSDRASSAYLVERSESVGRSISAGYRFAKVSKVEAASFRSKDEAEKIRRSIAKREGDGEYAVITL